MKRLLLIVAALYAAVLQGGACTNFLVGKKASADGSVFVSYSADSFGMAGFLAHYPASVNPEGTMRAVYDWDTGKYLGSIPEAPVTYNVIGNINEHQVTIAETTFGGRSELVDTTGIIDYGSLMYIALQRSRTAREAIEVMTSITQEYGYYSSGESFSIADPNEVWILEMIGKGREKGTVWVAVRIPDDCIAAHANQARIHKFDMKDKENVLYSKDVIKFARKKGYFNGKDEDFSFAMAYCPPDFGALRWCDARAWTFFNMYADADMCEYLPWASGDATAVPMPLYFKPKKKITLQDVQAAMRDHFEGTPFDVRQDIGGGIYNMPYRLSPLTFEYDGKEYFNERPVSTFQSAFTFVSQMRDYLPREIGGVLWFGCDDANMIVYTPVYCCLDRVPDCYSAANADPVTFSWKSSFWVFNWVSNMIYPKYSLVEADLLRVRGEIEKKVYECSLEMEKNVVSSLKESPKYALATIKDFSCNSAEGVLAAWKQFGEYIIVKYNDLVVKPEQGDKFKRTSTGIGETVIRPGYSEEYKKRLIEETGEKYLIPLSK